VRHLGSLIVAAVFAPSVLILAGRGLRWFTDAATVERTDEVAMLFALAALSLAGILYALLTLPRLSPLGPMLAGGAYLGVGLWALADLEHLLATVPGELAGLDDAAMTTTAAVAPLLAAPLLATCFSARRWRGREAEVADAPPGVPAGPPPPTVRPARRPAPHPPQHTRVMPTVVIPAATDLDSERPTEPIEPVTEPTPAPSARAGEPAAPSAGDTGGPSVRPAGAPSAGPSPDPGGSPREPDRPTASGAADRQPSPAPATGQAG
jgi:hypothetical protein